MKGDKNGRDQQKIGAFLKSLRNEQGFTQEELADKLNVTSRSISRWETGKNMPDISLLVQLAAVCARERPAMRFSAATLRG
jgi:transcriptional regulator with XRE-family HTH domain